MRPAFFDSPEYKKKQGEIVHLNWQKDIYNLLVKKSRRKCLSRNCNNYFIVPPSDKQKYCSQDCWYLVKRKYKAKIIPICINCGKPIVQRNACKFCSLKCQAKNNYNQYINRWTQGLEDGNIGITTRFISHYIKRYLLKKYKEKCSLCSWHERNPITKKVPLEIDHIDGNSENNKEENLRLICPNCHSLTPHFRNLNKGNGRSWRQKQSKIV